MARCVYFGFSTGIKRSLLVPAHRLEELADLAAWIERWFGWATERPAVERSADVPDGVPPPRRWWVPGAREIPRDPPEGWAVPPEDLPAFVRANPDRDPVYLRRLAVDSWRSAVCDRLWRHAELVRELYDDLTEEGQARLAPAGDGVVEWTPEAAADLWHALHEIDVPIEFWTAEHERRVLERAYEVLRGRGDGEYRLRGRALSPEQAGSVLWLFEQLLSLPNGDELRLEVPRGHDGLASSDEYDWCATCGAVANDDVEHFVRTCRRRGCDLRKEHAAREEER